MGEWAFKTFLGQLGLIVLAMVFARTCAMLANRLLDRHIDAANPRTAGRALPSGRLPVPRALGVFSVSALAFMLVCAAFGMFYGNWWPLILGLPVLAWICAYGFFKRFTSLCHLYLGSSLAISPIAAAIAIDPQTIWPASPLFQPALFLLSGMVLCWVAGFDVIYALQDLDVDRRDGLYSIPARFGMHRALGISRVLHTFAVACLVAAMLVDSRLHVLFGAGVALVIVLVLFEHATVARWGTTRLSLAFFTFNGVIACVLGLLGIVDVLV